jgi:L-ascorbate metabolism protein UlaG (beta-lactamase superfamily)
VTELALTHVGGPTTLLELGGWRILVDPTFDPPGRRYRFALGTSSTKLAGPALPPAALGPLDAVLLTHDHHADNLDAAGRELLRTVPVVVTTRAGARRLAGGARGLAAWERTTLASAERPTIEVTATPCRHGPRGSRWLVGDVVGFALTSAALPAGAVWVSGDTVVYDGVLQVAERVDVDVAVLHLGGVRFAATGPVRYSMRTADARVLVRRMQPRLAVPVHFDGWSHFAEGRAAVEAELARADAAERARWALLEPGVRTPLEALLLDRKHPAG